VEILNAMSNVLVRLVDVAAPVTPNLISNDDFKH
jgi:hypothetical protein